MKIQPHKQLDYRIFNSLCYRKQLFTQGNLTYFLENRSTWTTVSYDISLKCKNCTISHHPLTVGDPVFQCFFLSKHLFLARAVRCKNIFSLFFWKSVQSKNALVKIWILLKNKKVCSPWNPLRNILNSVKKQKWKRRFESICSGQNGSKK